MSNTTKIAAWFAFSVVCSVLFGVLLPYAVILPTAGLWFATVLCGGSVIVAAVFLRKALLALAPSVEVEQSLHQWIDHARRLEKTVDTLRARPPVVIPADMESVRDSIITEVKTIQASTMTLLDRAQEFGPMLASLSVRINSTESHRDALLAELSVVDAAEQQRRVIRNGNGDRPAIADKTVPALRAVPQESGS